MRRDRSHLPSTTAGLGSKHHVQQYLRIQGVGRSLTEGQSCVYQVGGAQASAAGSIQGDTTKALLMLLIPLVLHHKQLSCLARSLHAPGRNEQAEHKVCIETRPWSGSP